MKPTPAHARNTDVQRMYLPLHFGSPLHTTTISHTSLVVAVYHISAFLSIKISILIIYCYIFQNCFLFYFEIN